MPAKHSDPNPYLGAVFMIAAEFLFTAMGAGVRFVSEELANEPLVFFRNLFSLLLLGPWLFTVRTAGLRTQVPHLHLLRGLVGVSAMYCFFYAIASIPLADAILLKLSAPLFVPLVALVWLNEPVAARIWLAIAIGFGGVSLILDPSLDGIPQGALAALLGGVFAAVAQVTVRRLSRTEPPSRTVFYFAFVATLVSSVPLAWAWQTPSMWALSGLFAIALLATLGQLCLTIGMSLAPAARMGTFAYFAVIFGAGFGWLFWDEVLKWWTLIGSVLVICAGILAASGSKSRAAAPAAPQP